MKIEEQTLGVTGAAGFIGKNIVRRALKKDLEVNALIHNKDLGLSEEKNLNIFKGDIRNKEDLNEFCEKSDIIIHAAAILDEKSSEKLFHSVNVKGTANITRKAADKDVKRLIHISTVMVYGFNPPSEASENSPLKADHPYCKSKILSEDKVREISESSELKSTIVRPSDVYGPNSQPWVVRPLKMLNKGILILPDKGKGIIDPTHIDNLINGLFSIIEKDCTNETLNITDGNSMTAKEFFTYHKEMVGNARILTLPTYILKPLLKFSEELTEFMNSRPEMTAESLNFLTRPNGYSNHKAQKIIDYEPQISLEEGMKEVEKWAKRENII